MSDRSTRELHLSVPAEWVAQLDAIAAASQRPRDEVCREAIARYLAASDRDQLSRDEVIRLESELAALRQQLGRLDAVETALARLTRRQDSLERATDEPQKVRPAEPVSSASTAEDDAEDWGLFDDEPDEILADFLG